MMDPRFHTSLNLDSYSKGYTPLKVKIIDDIKVPEEPQYILRMIIKKMYSGYRIPEKFKWVKPILDVAIEHQKSIQINHPYVYLTIRNGTDLNYGDNSLHVDGFSMQFSHLPEQNYIWTSCYGTEYVTSPIVFPQDFDPFKHNIHYFLQDNLSGAEFKTMDSKCLYMIDPYCPHKRPDNIPGGTHRCMVRISFLPIILADVNNTPNELLETELHLDRVATFRNNLQRY